MSVEMRLMVVAASCFALACALGYVATHTTMFLQLDGAGAGLRGGLTGLAAIFTLSGRMLPLAILSAFGIGFAYVLRSGVVPAVGIAIAQVVAQGIVELTKLGFHRSRPDSWIVHQELGFSFPSGHAATAIVFFASWLLLIWAMPLPRAAKLIATVALGIWIIGIDWSRLALGAHYVTDVIGGTLMGVGCACILWAVLLHARAVPSL